MTIVRSHTALPYGQGRVTNVGVGDTCQVAQLVHYHAGTPQHRTQGYLMEMVSCWDGAALDLYLRI